MKISSDPNKGFSLVELIVVMEVMGSYKPGNIIWRKTGILMIIETGVRLSYIH